MLTLITYAGNEIPCAVVFEQETVRIGRDANNDLAIDDRTLSAQHCVIKARNDIWILSDSDSANGTWLVRRGRAIAADQRDKMELQLVSGDELRLGDSASGARRSGSGVGALPGRHFC